MFSAHISEISYLSTKSSFSNSNIGLPYRSLWMYVEIIKKIFLVHSICTSRSKIACRFLISLRVFVKCRCNSLFMELLNFFTRSHASIQRSSRFFFWVCDCIYVTRDVSRASQELRRSESKKAKLKGLSNIISKKRYERQTNELVKERCERESRYIADLLLGERSEVVGKAGIYYIINAGNRC